MSNVGGSAFSSPIVLNQIVQADAIAHQQAAAAAMDREIRDETEIRDESVQAADEAEGNIVDPDSSGQNEYERTDDEDSGGGEERAAGDAASGGRKRGPGLHGEGSIIDVVA